MGGLLCAAEMAAFEKKGCVDEEGGAGMGAGIRILEVEE
jgi:hypothetical protein